MKRQLIVRAIVIASEAKQSSAALLDCFVALLLAMTFFDCVLP
jgi:hypothetical protein